MYTGNLSMRFIEPRPPVAAGGPTGTLLGLLLAHQNAAAFTLDAADMTIAADARFHSLLRRPAPETPVPFGELLHAIEPETAAAISALALRAVATRGGFSARSRYRLPDGSIRLIEWEAASPPGEGPADHLVGVLRDVTEATERENLLDGQKEMIADLVDALPLPVAILDRRLRYIAVNRRWVDDFAMDCADGLVGRRHYDVFPDTPVHWRELHHIALNGERATRDRDVFVRPDGARLLVNWVLQPWRDKTGGVGGVVVLVEILRLAQAFGDARDRGDLAGILFGAIGPGPAATPDFLLEPERPA